MQTWWKMKAKIIKYLQYVVLIGLTVVIFVEQLHVINYNNIAELYHRMIFHEIFDENFKLNIISLCTSFALILTLSYRSILNVIERNENIISIIKFHCRSKKELSLKHLLYALFKAVIDYIIYFIILAIIIFVFFRGFDSSIILIYLELLITFLILVVCHFISIFIISEKKITLGFYLISLFIEVLAIGIFWRIYA